MACGPPWHIGPNSDRGLLNFRVISKSFKLLKRNYWLLSNTHTHPNKKTKSVKVCHFNNVYCEVGLCKYLPHSTGLCWGFPVPRKLFTVLFKIKKTSKRKRCRRVGGIWNGILWFLLHERAIYFLIIALTYDWFFLCVWFYGSKQLWFGTIVWIFLWAVILYESFFMIVVQTNFIRR